MGKSLFIMPFIMLMLGLAFSSGYFLVTDFSLAWGVTTVAIVSFAVIFLKLFQQNTVRTDPNFTVYVGLAIFSAAWGGFDTWSNGQWISWELAVSWIWLAAVSLYVFWYSRLDRPDNSDVLDEGKSFPVVELQDATGKPVSTEEFLRYPTLFMFYRGNWCPLCMAQIKEIAGLYRELDQRGIKTVLVSPQSHENTQTLAERHKVPFTYLIDSEFKLAKQLNLVHENGVPKGMTGYDEDTVFPTVVLTDERGNILHVDQTDNYRVRPEPETFLKIFDDYQVNSELEKKVQERTGAIKTLLDNIGEAIFSFGSDYSIHRDHSISAELIFGREIKYADPLRLLFSVGSESVKEITDMLFQGTGTWEVFEELLPKETQVNGKTLDLKYRWIPNEDPKVGDKIMVIAKDVTLERELAQQLEEDEAVNKMIIKVAVDRDGFVQLLRETDGLFQKIFETLDQGNGDANALFRYYHTIKGGTATYGMDTVAQQAHAIEAKLEGVRNQEQAFTAELLQEIVEDTQQLQATYTRTLDALGSLISQEDRSHAEQVYRISDSRLEALQDQVFQAVPKEAWNTIQSALADLRKQPIGRMLRKYAAAAEDLSKQLNKSVEVELEGEDLPVSYEKLEPVFSTLVHLVRNSVDHGIEEPSVRVMLGKAEAGRLRIKAKKEEQDLRLVIQDDGAGIDAETVKNIALKKNIISLEEAKAAKEEDLVKLIFAPGFSTKEAVTDISGRGVGMDAVKTSVEELSGRIDIHTIQDQGTQFELYLPNAA